MNTSMNILATIGLTTPHPKDFGLRRETQVVGWMFSRGLSGSLSEHQTSYNHERLLVGR